MQLGRRRHFKVSLKKGMEVPSFCACSCCCLIWGSRVLQRDSGRAPSGENLGLCSFFLAFMLPSSWKRVVAVLPSSMTGS